MAKFFKVVLLINPSRKYTQGILSGIAKYSRVRGMWNFYRPLDYREKKDKTNLLQVLKSLKPDGILIREPTDINKIIEMNIPTVTFPYSRAAFPKIANAIVDHIAVGEMAAGHFLDRGYHHFAYIGFEDWWWSLRRREGFLRRLQQAGYEIHTYASLTKKKLKWSNELPQIADWIRSLPKPIAVMACNDDRGELVIEACKMATTHVATRQSTDILAIEDKEVTAAVKFIRKNIKKNLCVLDVVNHVALSRRVLEKRFRKLLDRSIHVEIKRNRIKLMEQMLYDTTMSIIEIAHELNFDDITHFSRYFRKEKGISPNEYRKKFCLFNSFHHDFSLNDQR